MQSFSEKQLRDALAALKNKRLTQCEAEKEYGIHRSTLKNKLKVEMLEYILYSNISTLVYGSSKLVPVY